MAFRRNRNMLGLPVDVNAIYDSPRNNHSFIVREDWIVGDADAASALGFYRALHKVAGQMVKVISVSPNFDQPPVRAKDPIYIPGTYEALIESLRVKAQAAKQS